MYPKQYYFNMLSDISCSFSMLSFWNPMCILHEECILVQTRQTHFKCSMWPHVVNSYYIGQCSFKVFFGYFLICPSSLFETLEVRIFHILKGNTIFIICNIPRGSRAALHDQTNISIAKVWQFTLNEIKTINSIMWVECCCLVS